MANAPLERALLSLEGLSVGDALGERVLGAGDRALNMIVTRATPRGPWSYTDDTEMALSIVAELAERGRVDQDALARAFAARMDPKRGYGGGAYCILKGIRAGRPWRRLARDVFLGEGSFGNGAAMRVAPLGAYFAEDLERVVTEARASAEVTHAHAEGIAGAIAVAVGAALAATEVRRDLPLGVDWLRRILGYVPTGEVHDGIAQAIALSSGTRTAQAARALGNGAGVTAPDTVPFCLWIASWYSHDYAEAFWQTASAGGDVDTTCAIVGAIVALQVGEDGIPAAWRDAREELPDVCREEGRPRVD